MTVDAAAQPPPDWPQPRSAYIHVPFCRHRCGYCNFSVIAGRDDLAGPYLDALQRELSGLGDPRPIDTLFIGGGTPTRLPRAGLERLFDLLERWFPMSAGGERSVEANPEDIDRPLLRLLADRGVNRISLGVQSFCSKKLRRLERGHSGDAARDAVVAAAEVIGNVSIDLIFAVPGETLAGWREDLRQAIRLPIRHLSTYSLTFEKGTQFWNRRLHGRIEAVDEETELAMYAEARRTAKESGFEHYEISNFARSGGRCRHNVAYWQGRGWFAAGPGAAKFVDGRREVNHQSPTGYIRRLLAGRNPVAQSEPISPQQWACERAAFGIRMLDGIDLADIACETGVDVAAVRREAIDRCLAGGLIEAQGARLRLTEPGIIMADGVAAELL